MRPRCRYSLLGGGGGGVTDSAMGAEGAEQMVSRTRYAMRRHSSLAAGVSAALIVGRGLEQRSHGRSTAVGQYMMRR